MKHAIFICMGIQIEGSLLQFPSMCLSDLYKHQRNLYFHLHEINKKITITIFMPCYSIVCQSYNDLKDIKGLMVCMFSNYHHIDHIDYNNVYSYLLHKKGSFFSLVFFLATLFKVLSNPYHLKFNR